MDATKCHKVCAGMELWKIKSRNGLRHFDGFALTMERDRREVSRLRDRNLKIEI
jgi:hypothetical protein